jgi:hypothetical protein
MQVLLLGVGQVSANFQECASPQRLCLGGGRLGLHPRACSTNGDILTALKPHRLGALDCPQTVTKLKQNLRVNHAPHQEKYET